MVYVNITGRRLTRRGWLTLEARKERLHHALKANYDPFPAPPLKWHLRWVCVNEKRGRIAEDGRFEPDARQALYPQNWILPDRPLWEPSR